MNASENAPEMLKNAPKLGLVLLGKEERNVTFQNASKMRGTPLGENTFWTIPREWPFHSESVSPETGVVPRLLTFSAGH